MPKPNAKVITFIVALLASQPAYGQDPASSKGTLDLNDMLRGFRSRYSLSTYHAKLRDLQESKIANDGRRLQRAPNLGVEGERSLGNERERKVTAKFRQSITLGIEQSVLIDRYSMEAAAELTSKEGELKNQEKEIASLYTRVRLAHELHAISKATLATLGPLVKRAKRAAEQGTLGGFFARRCQILLTKIESDLAEMQTSYVADANALANATGVVIPDDPSFVTFAPIPFESAVGEFREEVFLPLKTNQLRQKALAAEATQVKSVSEISAGLGFTHDLETQQHGVIVEVEIPLFSSAVSQSAVRDLIAERNLLAADADLAAKRARDQFIILSASVARVKDTYQLAKQRVENLTTLYRDAEKAFNNAQAEIVEVVETLSELYEAQGKLAERAQELDEAIINLQYSTGGSL